MPKNEKVKAVLQKKIDQMEAESKPAKKKAPTKKKAPAKAKAKSTDTLADKKKKLKKSMEKQKKNAKR